MKKTSLILSIPLLFLLQNCGTDFDLNAEWKDIAVVYGIIDQTDTAQYIKLNKAFLGNSDAYMMAQESDSLFYPEAEVYLELLNDTAHVYDNYGNRRRIKLEPTNAIAKDSGIFAYDYNQLYITDEALDAEYNYGLLVKIPGKEKITSSTTLVEGLDIIKPTSIQRVGFADNNGPIPYRVEWKANEVAEIYSLVLRFHWTEELPTGEVSEHTLDWAQASKRKLSDDEKMYMEIDGDLFFQFIADNIDIGVEATYRVATGIDFLFTVAGKELASYIDVNGPSDGIIQERPTFTNINNGIGVFSSRFTKSVEMVKLSTLTLDWLSCGDETRHLRFADGWGNFDCLNGK